MPRARRNEPEQALSPSSRQRPTASRRRRRRVDGSNEQLDVSEPGDPSSSVDPSVSEQYASPSAIVPHTSHQEQPYEHNDISDGPLPGGPTDLSILKSFKNHVALAIWSGQVSYVNFFFCNNVILII